MCPHSASSRVQVEQGRSRNFSCDYLSKAVFLWGIALQTSLLNFDLGSPTFSYEVLEDTFLAFKRIRNSYCSSKQQFISVKYIYS